MRFKYYFALVIVVIFMTMLVSAIVGAQQTWSSQQYNSDLAKGQVKRWQMQQDMNSRIFEIQPNVTVSNFSGRDRMFGRWDHYIGGNYTNNINNSTINTVRSNSSEAGKTFEQWDDYIRS